MPAERFRVHSLARSAAALLVIVLAIAISVPAWHLEFGIGWIVLIPCALALAVGLGLLQRHEIRVEGPGRIVIVSGWLFRRHLTIGLGGSELELVPTLGLIAVVLHRSGRAWPLAEWLGSRRAADLAELLDRCAGSPIPRKVGS